MAVDVKKGLDEASALLLEGKPTEANELLAALKGELLAEESAAAGAPPPPPPDFNECLLAIVKALIAALGTPALLDQLYGELVKSIEATSSGAAPKE